MEVNVRTQKRHRGASMGLFVHGERVRVLVERLAGRLRGPVMGGVGEAEGVEEGNLI